MNSSSPEQALIARAASVLRAGGLVAFPTETVYGLGANALDAAAVRRIFDAKGRPSDNPLIVHVASRATVHLVASEWPPVAERLAARFWPGPLTLVLPRAAAVPIEVTAGGPTVAVRWPAHPVAEKLLAAAGIPLAAPSANRSSGLSPTRADHVLRDLDGLIDLVLDAGPTAGGIESTVLDVTNSPPRLLRPGLINLGEIEAIVGSLGAPHWAPAPSRPLPSPGMLARHYAPRTPLELAFDSGWDLVRAHGDAGRRVGWLAFPPVPERLPDSVKLVVMPSAARSYARCLYAVLRDLDDSGVDRIVVALPPEMPEWLAVRDRLYRAAAR